MKQIAQKELLNCNKLILTQNLRRNLILTEPDMIFDDIQWDLKKAKFFQHKFL